MGVAGARLGMPLLHGFARLLFLAALALPPQCRADATAPLDGERIAFALEDLVRIPSIRVNRAARLNALVSPPDGSHRLFVVDLDGAILVVENGKLSPRSFLDLAQLRRGVFVANGLEEGLNSIAFHPDFAHPGTAGFGKFYTFSSERADPALPTLPTRSGLPVHHHDVIAEWSVDVRTPSVADPASRREVLRVVHPTEGHLGGHLGFNPGAHEGDSDYGMLYIAVGDGADTVHDARHLIDEWHIAQDKRLALGKILRIDPLPHGDKPYAVPRDNPFVRDPSALPEIWAYGLRNPERFSWDSAGTHLMLIADIGQRQFEELDIGHAGANYGWSLREGFTVVDHADQSVRGPVAADDVESGLTAPVLAYGHHGGLAAITGGYVYRGQALPQLRGYYVFGDIVSGRIYATDASRLVDGKQATFYELPLQYKGQPQTLQQIVRSDRADLRFGTDDAGEIYVLSKRNGVVYRFARAVAVAGPIRPADPGDP
jgi:glucose/arabinose dehydrogenase